MTTPTSPTTLHRRPDHASAHPAPPASERWWTHAECRFFGPAPFFALDSETPAERARRERTAKLICRPCPVRFPCLQQALATGENHGIWGGTSERERKRW